MPQSVLNLKKTRDIARPHYYVRALIGEYADFAFTEEDAPKNRGSWRKNLQLSEDHPLDLEIGTGNGYFFAHRSQSEPSRFLLGIEVKFKPLIQSIRRAQKGGSENMRGVRYDAKLVEDLFEPEELNHVFIHHPDPWLKPQKHKRRLVSREFLNRLFALQKPNCFVDLKTDSQDYFQWMLKEISYTPYKLERETTDLHGSEWATDNFVTHFEQLFINQGYKIAHARLIKA